MCGSRYNYTPGTSVDEFIPTSHPNYDSCTLWQILHRTYITHFIKPGRKKAKITKTYTCPTTSM